MSRISSGEQKREYKILVAERLAERLDLLSFDPKTGRGKYGFITSIFELGVIKLLEGKGMEKIAEFATENGIMDISEAQKLITDMRVKALAGTATREEVRECLAQLREGRMTVVGQKTTKKKVKEAAKPIDLDSLLG